MKSSICHYCHNEFSGVVEKCPACGRDKFTIIEEKEKGEEN